MIGALLVIAQLAIVSHAPDTASTCEAIEISVAVSAPGGVPPVVVAPSLFPFDVLRSSGTPHISYDTRGTGSIVAEYRYVITTDRTGTFAIAPFEARLGNEVARSRPTFISVRPATRGSVPSVIARARVDTSLEVNFRALSLPETVYVGQQANYEVAVFLNETVRDRLRRNPTFFPPDMQSMLAYDLPARADPPRRQVGSHCYDALVYQRALFPLMPGRFSIPPAQLVYSLPLSASFFSREETHELQTDSTVVVAVEPPMLGRPSDYGGAVGNLHVAAKLDTSASRVGDPMRLTVRVSGTGNVKLFPRPAIGVPWGALVNGDERVEVDTTARRIAGAKEFDWVLTPKIAGELDLPPIHYPYFNPESRRYETATTGVEHVHVNPGTLASADTVKSETLLSLRTRYRGAPSTPLHEHPVFWALLALAPLPAISFGSRERRRRAAALAPVNRAARLDALARPSSSSTASEVRRAYTAALSERLGLEAESFTRPGALTRALRRRGVSTEVAQQAEQLLRRLDESAFAQGGVLPPGAAARAASLYHSVDAEALPRAQISLRAGAALAIALACGGL
ncbi:MAG: BatD family protein, partial [Gemmatimonadaceae bacterium]